MAGKPVKTNAMRALDQRKVEYDVLEYDSSIHSADIVASTLGLPSRLVYKTLVLQRDRGKPLLVMVGGDLELDLRVTARSVGEKRLSMASQKDAERLTGLLVGGIGALALLNRGFDIFIDERALSEERILVNAGQRGVNLRLSVSDLIVVTGAKPITVA